MTDTALCLPLPLLPSWGFLPSLFHRWLVKSPCLHLKARSGCLWLSVLTPYPVLNASIFLLRQIYCLGPGNNWLRLTTASFSGPLFRALTACWFSYLTVVHYREERVSYLTGKPESAGFWLPTPTRWLITISDSTIEDLRPCSGLHGHQAHTRGTYILAGKSPYM